MSRLQSVYIAPDNPARPPARLPFAKRPFDEVFAQAAEKLEALAEEQRHSRRSSSVSTEIWWKEPQLPQARDIYAQTLTSALGLRQERDEAGGTDVEAPGVSTGSHRYFNSHAACESVDTAGAAVQRRSRAASAASASSHSDGSSGSGGGEDVDDTQHAEADITPLEAVAGMLQAAEDELVAAVATAEAAAVAASWEAPAAAVAEAATEYHGTAAVSAGASTTATSRIVANAGVPAAVPLAPSLSLPLPLPLPGAFSAGTVLAKLLGQEDMRALMARNSTQLKSAPASTTAAVAAAPAADEDAYTVPHSTGSPSAAGINKAASDMLEATQLLEAKLQLLASPQKSALQRRALSPSPPIRPLRTQAASASASASAAPHNAPTTADTRSVSTYEGPTVKGSSRWASSQLSAPADDMVVPPLPVPAAAPAPAPAPAPALSDAAAAALAAARAAVQELLRLSQQDSSASTLLAAAAAPGHGVLTPALRNSVGYTASAARSRYTATAHGLYGSPPRADTMPGRVSSSWHPASSVYVAEQPSPAQQAVHRAHQRTVEATK